MAEAFLTKRDGVPERTESLSLSSCGSCKKEFTDKNSRILPCLHCFCEACLAPKPASAPSPVPNSSDVASTSENAESSTLNQGTETSEAADSQADADCVDDPDEVLESSPAVRRCARTSTSGKVMPPSSEITRPLEAGKIRCLTCEKVFDESDALVNTFASFNIKHEPKSEKGSELEEKFHVCMACDDADSGSQSKATSFCVECQEWLCDQCVSAHKRVRITKDHTFTTEPEPETSDVQETKIQRQMFCTVHKTEKMKLFCLTCDTLTCRDCQLLEHKDHNYQFINEAVSQQKDSLETAIQTLKSLLDTSTKQSEKMSVREKDIKRQQMAIFSEVRQVADQVTNELIGYCKRLLNFLSGVCYGKVKALTDKKSEVDSFSRNAQHCISFVESALASGDEMSILFTKSLMMKQLKSLLDTHIEVGDGLFELNMKYDNEASFLSKNVIKMGTLTVNGRTYPTPVQQDQPPQPPSSTQTKNQNVSQQIAEWLNQYPPNVREQYKRLGPDDRKQFLHQLVQAHLRSKSHRQYPVPPQFLISQQQQMQHQQQAQHQQQQQQQRFTNDNSAIQDLYKTHPHQGGQGGNAHMVHPSGTFFPSNSTGAANNMGQGAFSNRTRPQSFQPTQTSGFFNWRGADRGLHNSCHGFPDQDYTSFIPSMSGPGARAPPAPFLSSNTSPGSQGAVAGVNPAGTWGAFNNRPQGPATSRPAATAETLPATLSIDPLRVKQEPKETERLPCAFMPKPQSTEPASSATVPATSGASLSTSPRLQSPSTARSGHLPTSPGPTVPDFQMIEDDAQAALKKLNPHFKVNAYNLYPKHDPNDPSEDYCAVCHNGGDLLCCDRCPKVFHLQCHVPAIVEKPNSNEQWFCVLCMADDEILVNTPVPKDSYVIVPGTGKRKAPSGLADKELKVCERILLELFCLESSVIFHEPVSKQVPNYYKIITHPMDFGSVKHKLRRGHFNHYNDIEAFLSDMKRVFRNCFLYNQPQTEIYQVGKSVQGVFEELVKRFLPCYVDYINRDTPSPESDISDSSVERYKPKKRRSPAPDSTVSNSNTPEMDAVHYC